MSEIVIRHFHFACGIGGGARKRVEALWLNPATVEALTAQRQPCLLAGMAS